MVSWRSLISSALRSRPILKTIQTPVRFLKQKHPDQMGPPQAFDNLPFSIPNRYVATFCFAIFFGVGLWAPFLLVWYMMAKRTL